MSSTSMTRPSTGELTVLDLHDPRVRVTASFDAQAWLGGHALSVDPQGDTDWDATTFALEHLAYLTRLLDGTGSFESLTDGLIDVDDVFRADPNAPAWVRDWTGPFTITVTAARAGGAF